MKAWERGRWEGYCTGPKPSGQRRSSEMPSREGREWLVDLDRHLRVFRGAGSFGRASSRFREERGYSFAGVGHGAEYVSAVLSPIPSRIYSSLPLL
jgi:hypothetical protein